MVHDGALFILPASVSCFHPPSPQALRLVQDDPEAAEASIKQLLETVGHLPYLGTVHDGALVILPASVSCFHPPPTPQALRLALDNPEAAEASVKQLLEIVGHLPYLGMVHDGALVLDACDQLCIMAESAESLPEEERVMYQGLCKAVRAHFAPSTNAEQQKEVLPVVSEGRGGGNNAQREGVER